MALLSFTQAAYSCSQFGRSGRPTVSFRRTYESQPEGVAWVEGQAGFAEFRDAALREVERLLFMAVSQYRRSFELAIPSASGWAYVTLYYSGFFAAKALLGMFGAWRVEHGVIEAVTGNPGVQHFSVLRGSRRGSATHKAFWAYFYSEASALTNLVDTSDKFALQPVNGDIHWLTRKRNDYNYDMSAALSMILAAQASLPTNQFPTCFPADLRVQYEHSSALLRMAGDMASQLGLSTDVLDLIQPSGGRPAKLRAAIRDAPTRDLSAHFISEVFDF